MVAGLLVGAISSLLGVAGGEFIIPILIFAFGADIRTAGTASVLISIPVVLTGVARHWLTGHYRSQSLLVYSGPPDGNRLRSRRHGRRLFGRLCSYRCPAHRVGGDPHHIGSKTLG